MPEGIAYLKGGKCDGRTHKLTSGEKTYGSVECRGGLYVVSVPAKYHHGDRIFNYSGKAINPGTLPQPKAAKLHKGYADVQHSVNHNMPAALRRSHHSLEAGLRSLNRARKVKL